MTFEEFFIKKRIDLPQLEKAEPNLYKEFKSHFEQMGEKSFDHTKKFWFNRLRKSFHLKEEAIAAPTPISPSPLDENKAIAAAESPQAAKPTGFKPRFKASQSAEDKKSPSAPNEESKTENKITAPPGLKSRFKAGQTTSLKEEKTEDQSIENKNTPSTTEQQIEKVNKPAGFKPRFKPGMTNKEAAPSDSSSISAPEVKNNEQEGTETQKTDDSANISKPVGFKPRFKAGLTNKVNTGSPKKEETALHTEDRHVNELSQSTEKTEADQPDNVSKPTGFKPRFKATKKASDPPGLSASERNEKAEPPAENNTEEIRQNTQSTKPVGFKPRFKAGTTKTQSLEKDEINQEALPNTKEQPLHREPSKETIDLSHSSAQEKEQEDKTKATAKPLGFKPRFKPAAKKGNTTDDNE